MIKLNLPEYNFRMEAVESTTWIFDPIRKKKVVLTPEEWVRQNFLQYLIREKQVPESLVRVEMGLKLNKLTRRGDIVVFNRTGQPLLIVECKSPDVKLNQKVFDQVARYNLVLKVDYLIITNGLKHFCCRMDYPNHAYHFLESIPDYSKMTGVL